MSRFFANIIAALNTISSPILAVIVIILGCAYSILSKQYGLDGNTAAGIVGAGIGLLTGQVLSASKSQSGGGRPDSTQQSTGAPATGETFPSTNQPK